MSDPMQTYLQSKDLQHTADDANQATRETAANALALQREQYNQTREDLAPYRGLGTAVLPYYQSAITGEAVDGKMYNPEASPSLKYLTEVGDRTLGNALKARGMSGSLQGATALADQRSRLLSEDYWRRLSLLGGAIDVGRGAQTATSAAGQNYANQGSSIWNNLGSSLSSNIQNLSSQQTSLYNNAQSATMSGLSTLLGGLSDWKNSMTTPKQTDKVLKSLSYA